MKRLVILSILSILFVAGAGCPTEDTKLPVQVDNDENVMIIETSMGREFTIQLPSNPTTGYSWQLSSLPTGSIQLQNKTFKLADEMENIVGEGGYEIWTFMALKKETVELTFDYKRPWEKEEPPTETKKIRIVIN